MLSVTAACFALSMGGQICVASDRVTCLDANGVNIGVLSCTAQAEFTRRQMQWCNDKGLTSPDGSTTSCLLPNPGTSTIWTPIR